MRESETERFRKRDPDGLGSSHTSARCVMFNFSIVLNVLLNSRRRQASFCEPAESRSMAVSTGGRARVQRDSPAAERAITVRDIEEIRLFQQKLATASPTER